MDKEELPYTVGRNTSWCSHSGKQYGCCLKKLKIELYYDPTIALLSIYPKDTNVVTCTPVFIAAMSTIAKLWKEPRCPSTDEWIKMWCIYIQWNITQPSERMNTSIYIYVDRTGGYYAE